MSKPLPEICFTCEVNQASKFHESPSGKRYPLCRVCADYILPRLQDAVSTREGWVRTEQPRCEECGEIAERSIYSLAQWRYFCSACSQKWQERPFPKRGEFGRPYDVNDGLYSENCELEAPVR